MSRTKGIGLAAQQVRGAGFIGWVIEPAQHHGPAKQRWNWTGKPSDVSAFHAKWCPNQSEFSPLASRLPGPEGCLESFSRSIVRRLSTRPVRQLDVKASERRGKGRSSPLRRACWAASHTTRTIFAWHPFH